ncbi:MAG: hypothetical protein ABSH44_10170 [Bryobacteraceae bacterium]|jgi:hypothetical protein
MLKVSTTRGICSACKHDLVCIYPRDFDRPPLQCEEFELGFMPAEIAAARQREIAELEALARAPLPKPEDSREYLGLCVNCENREACIYPKPEGGVWRCEEYE